MEDARTNGWVKPQVRLVALLETRWRLLLIILFAGFVGLAVHGRGPFRRATYHRGWTDVLPMCGQTKAWIAGMDPYSETSRLGM